MKIQNINNYKQNYYFKNNTKNKQQHINFQGIVTQNKMKKFIPELGSFLFNSNDLNLKNIENFLKKFKPNLKVNFVSANSIIGKAQAQTIMGIDPFFNPIIISESIDLTVDKAENFESKLQLFEWLVHEMTHIYQADFDSDEEGTTLVNIKYMRDKIIQNPTDETVIEVKKNSDKIQNIFHELEVTMLKTIQSQLNSTNLSLKPIKNLDILDIESAYYRAFGKTSRAFIRDFVKNKIKIYGIKDSSFVEKVIKTQANNEIEAYDISTKAVKNILSTNFSSTNNLMKLVFKIISNIDLEE